MFMTTKKAVITEINHDEENPVAIAYGGKVFKNWPLTLMESGALMTHLDAANACQFGFTAGIEFEYRTHKE
jgi:hypothetical protein